MKIYVAILTLLIPCSLYAAASSHDERQLPFEDHPTSMLLCDIKQAWETTTQTLGAAPTGTVPGIYQEILEKGFTGFCKENPLVVQRSLQIRDHFRTDFCCTCCHRVIHNLMHATSTHFVNATTNYKYMGLWEAECFGFSTTLMFMQNGNPLCKKFKRRVMIQDRIIDNNGIQGTEKERIEVAAYILVTSARFSERFVTMGKNKKRFAKFWSKMPRIFERLKQAKLEN